MAIERYYEIARSEIDPENLFFSVIERAKEKHILDEKELSYTDAELHKMINEVARLCGKGYIKEDSARTMLRNIFMILDSRFSPDAVGEILDAVKERRLWQEWEAGTSESLKYFGFFLPAVTYIPIVIAQIRSAKKKRLVFITTKD